MENNNGQTPFNNQNYGGGSNYGGYEPDDNYDNYDNNYGNEPNRSVKGLKIMIVVLALILAALSAIYFLQVKQMRDDFSVERDTLTNQLMSIRNDYDTLRTFNDTLAAHYDGERQKVDSLIQTLQKERHLSYAKIRQYEKEKRMMQTIMAGYLRQIDSLNTINKQLVNENSSIRKKVLDYRLRAESAEEKSQELTTKVKQGAVIRARDIRLVALSKSDREVTRANRADQLRVDLVLVGNELSTPGERNIYVQITGPDGFVLANASNAMFDYEGSPTPYSATRSVDYQNDDLSVRLFYKGGGISGGVYKVKIFADGHMIGSSSVNLR